MIEHGIKTVGTIDPSHLRIVEVTWVDACHENGDPTPFSQLGTALTLSTRVSVGYLSYQDETKTIVSTGVDTEGEEPFLDCHWIIPTGWITGIKFYTLESSPLGLPSGHVVTTNTLIDKCDKAMRDYDYLIVSNQLLQPMWSVAGGCSQIGGSKGGQT